MGSTPDRPREVVRSIGGFDRSVHLAGLHVLEAGVGPTVLCLHGIGSGAMSFAPQVPCLADRWRIAAWDAPGYGRSPDPSEPLHMSAYADAAAAVIEALGGVACVVGVSFGGVIAIELALSHRHLVPATVLVSSSSGSGGTMRSAEAMEQRVDELARDGIDRFSQRRARKLVSPSSPPELVSRVAGLMADSVREPGYRSAARAMATTDLSPRLHELDVPTLIVVGTEDQVTGVPAGMQLQSRMPMAHIEVVDGAGHLVNQEAPELFCVLISEFLEEPNRTRRR